MTNTDIIISEAVANGLYTMEQIENILALLPCKGISFYRRPSREIEIKNNPQGIEPRGRFSSCGILFYKPVL